ncbi:MAG: RHS repeat-associated core domain-containing protein [Blastocatellia bacterium]
MNNITVRLNLHFIEAIKRTFGMMLLLLLLAIRASAQATSPTDGLTPSGLTPGSPAGSYPLSGFDTINPYNGNLDLHLPLLQIGGRGDAQMMMMLTINTKRWRVKHSSVLINGEPVESFIPEPNSWSSQTGFGTGSLSGRRTGAGNFSCFGFPKLYTTTLTKLTFTTPDGTEYELRDQLTGGQPVQPGTGCSTSSISRGTIFVTADGTSMTFISDTPIVDTRITSGSGTLISVSGILLMRNGLRYRIDSGRVTWIKDRNGNKLSFDYNEFGQVTTITDSLSRVVHVNYMVSDPTYGLVDQLTFNGVNGVQRVVSIANYTPLANAFRPGAGYSVKTYKQLFPEIDGSQTTQYNPQLTSAIYLPNGKSYQFYYNPYGELERVVLPTGGAIEYRLPTGSGVYATFGDYQIYRRVSERLVLADGANLESKMVFTANHSLPTDPKPWTTSVNIEQKDVNGTVLARNKHYYNGSGLASLFESYGYYFYSGWDEGKEVKTEIFNNAGATLTQRVKNDFEQRDSVPWWSAYAAQFNIDLAREPALDPRLVNVDTILFDTSPNLVSAQKYFYDQYNNRTATEEFDYGSGSVPVFPTRRTEIDYVTVGENNGIDYRATNVHLRSLPKEQRVYSVNTANGTLTQVASTHLNYDQTGLTNQPGIIRWEAPATAARGNLTTTSHWLDTGGTVTTSQQYDIAGRTVQSTDAMGNTSLIEFANAFNTYAFATTLRTPVPDPTGQRGSSTRLVALYDYDFSTGALKSVTDPNQQVTIAAYNDSLDRLTGVTTSDGGFISYTYGDAVGNLFLRAQTKQSSTVTLESYQYFDGLGRKVKASQTEGSGSIFAETKYDPLGRVSQVSNPYRTGDTLRWTVTQYDGLSRVVSVTMPGGAVTSTGYLGNQVTVTDPAPKVRKSTSDALGRITQVIEDPASLNYQTAYTYDALDNMRKVAQGPAGSQQLRYFMYDSLSRLIRTKNPEHDVNTNLPALTDPVTQNSQWSWRYSYDGNGNLTSKIDPRNITCNYSYDALNRVTTHGYAGDPNQTPSVTNKYDGVGAVVQNALGRLTLVTASSASGFASSTSYDNFDASGLVLHSTQTTDGQPYGMGYQYDFAGHLISQTYPSGRTVATSFDGSGRIIDVSSGATHYVSSFSYAAHGGVKDLKLGNNLWEHTEYEPNRLQPTEMRLGTAQGAIDRLKLGYGYGTLTTNNGNLKSQTITVPGIPVLTQDYTYDGVNRLLVAQENNAASWKQTFTYDRYGNRRFDAANTTPINVLGPNPTIDTATNRYAAGQGYSYDLAGNLKNEPGKIYDYDAENRLVNYNNGAAKYYYDGDGRRVKTVVGSVTTLYVYNASGQLIAEYKSDPVPPPAGGGGTSYMTTDHLGSTRVVTNGSGVVKARYDYLPYGEEIASNIGGRSGASGYGGADSTRQKFTSKERDNETGLDYFLARYYSSAQGRFTSPDIPFAGQDYTNPQSWNLYTYCGNNPLTLVDLDGHRWFYKQENGKVTDIQWVNPNKDGSYTSPGEGYQEFIPTEQHPYLALMNAAGTVEYHFWEGAAGQPIARGYATGRVEDASVGLVMDYLVGKGIGSLIGRAFSSFASYVLRTTVGDAAARYIGGLTSAQAAKLLSILERIPGVKQVRAFGSRTTGAFTAGSDLDIALLGNINRYDPGTLKLIREAQAYAESIGVGTGKTGRMSLDINVWRSASEMKSAFRGSPGFDAAKGVPKLVPLE